MYVFFYPLAGPQRPSRVFVRTRFPRTYRGAWTKKFAFFMVATLVSGAEDDPRKGCLARDRSSRSVVSKRKRRKQALYFQLKNSVDYTTKCPRRRRFFFFQANEKCRMTPLAISIVLLSSQFAERTCTNLANHGTSRNAFLKWLI